MVLCCFRGATIISSPRRQRVTKALETRYREGRQQEGGTLWLGDVDLNGMIVVLFEFKEMPCYSRLLGS